MPHPFPTWPTMAERYNRQVRWHRRMQRLRSAIIIATAFLVVGVTLWALISAGGAA